MNEGVFTDGLVSGRSGTAMGNKRARGLVVRLSVLLVLVFAMIAAVGVPVGHPQRAAAEEDGTTFPEFAPAFTPPSTVYIPATGHSIDGWFLDMWRQNGGATYFGNPITAEITRPDGSIVQYYQYARFEYWPNGDVNGNQIALGDIGDELRPAVVPRMAVGGASSKASQLNRIALAWEPLAQDKIKPDSDSYQYVETTGHSVYDGFLRFWQNNSLDWFIGDPISEEYVVDGVHYQVFERGELRWKQGEDITLVPVGEMMTRKLGLSTDATAQGDLPVYDESLFIAPAAPTMSEVIAESGADPNGEKWFDVDLTNEYLVAYQGDTPVLQTLVSTGLPGHETPAGEFYILQKLPVQTMSGVIGGEYYNVPDVPDVEYFTPYGHAIHGTYWHNNFGHEMSHGCVNVPLDLAHFLYEWSDVGDRVEVHY